MKIIATAAFKNKVVKPTSLSRFKGIAVGDIVSHPRYGNGTVKAIQQVLDPATKTYDTTFSVDFQKVQNWGLGQQVKREELTRLNKKDKPQLNAPFQMDPSRKPVDFRKAV